MRKFMYFAAALLVLVGCNKKDNSIENTPKEVVTIKGSIELPQTPHKIAAPTGWENEIDPFTMLWEEGDKIYIYNEGDEANRQEFILATGEGSNDGTFAGTTLPNMSAYKVAYGYDPALTSTEYTVSYIEGNYRPFAEGAGTNYDFAINNFGPVIGLQLKGDGAFSKIEVALLNNSKATLATYTMTFAEALTLTEEVTKVYFPIQAKEGAVKIAISFYKKVNSEEVLTLTKTTNVPSANNVTTFPVLTFQSAYEYVDLGLPSGLKWATCNVGATTPEGYGDYFAWGETEPYYSSLSPLTWKEGKTSGYAWQSYCGQSSFKEWSTAPYDANKILKLEFDAAHVNWEGNWRMPTKAEQEELKAYCTWTWTTNYNGTGIKGYIVTSKADGNTNSIFLPASGARVDTSSPYTVGSYGYYWSSSLLAGDSSDAIFLKFSSSPASVDMSYRYYGRSVRPVCQ